MKSSKWCPDCLVRLDDNTLFSSLRPDTYYMVEWIYIGSIRIGPPILGSAAG